MADDLQIFPITEWSIGWVTQYGLVLFQPRFVESQTQRIEDDKPAQRFALSKAQCEMLIEDLQGALEKLQSGESEAP